MRTRETSERRVVALALLVGMLSACAPAQFEPELEQTRHAEQRLTAAELSTLGFESPSSWVSVWQPATLTRSNLHTEGQYSLAVSNVGSTAVRNAVAIKKDGNPAPSVIGYDIRIPPAAEQVDPTWYGDTQLYLNAPSVGIYSQWMGRVGFDTVTPGVFQRVQFAVPASVRTKLSGNYNDLTITVAIITPQGNGTHYLDRFTLGPVTCAPVDDGNPCTLDACDAAGQPTHQPLPAGSSCSNQNICDGAEVCNATGACQAGTPPVLDDSNPCTSDTCNPVSGVVHEPAAVGVGCSDTNVCNGQETCDGAGNCSAGTPLAVDDGNLCTADACDPINGVVHTPVLAGTDCSDADLCNGSESCNGAGTCVVGTPSVVDDGNPCTLDACTPSTGVTHTPLPSGSSCANATVCDGTEACNSAGTCQAGMPIDPDDGNPCTLDACDPIAGAVHQPTPGTSCSDANACNGVEVCDGSGLCQPGTPPLLDDQNGCTSDSCDPMLGVSHQPVAEGTSCGDADVCNGFETCDGAGSCQLEPPEDLDDDNPCTVGVCDPVLGVQQLAVSEGTSCADADACNGEELCDGAGECAPGVTPSVDDGNPCTVDSCDPIEGVVHAAAAVGTTCLDDDACNGAEVCNGAGLCQSGVPPPVDDGNPCTDDSCEAAIGLVHAPKTEGSDCADDDLCNGDERCDGAGTCIVNAPSEANDGNPCTVDACDPELGTIHTPLPEGALCSDGNPCNGEETCNSAAVCLGGTPPEVDDGNPCTADSCDGVVGVTHTPIAEGTACGDGDACNGLELCDAMGACRAGTPPILDDGNPCTADSCDPVAGVSHFPVPSGTLCDDADVCNGIEACDGEGTCDAGSPPTIDDGDPCTVDSCDPVGGVAHAPAAAGVSCADADLCNGDEVCNGWGSCTPGAPPELEDGNPCTIGTCDPVTGPVQEPVAAGTSCSDGDACNGQETCNGSASCQSGIPLEIDDGNSCTEDSCDPTGGVSHLPSAAGTSCADLDECNGAEQCDGSGACIGNQPSDIDDGNPCTADACTAEAGVTHLPMPAGTSCSDGDACNGAEACTGQGVCEVGETPVVDDGNPCTVDSCDPSVGVVHQLLAPGTSCSDGDSCNGEEVCGTEGSCLLGEPLPIDDGNPCTVDSCDSEAGVSHAPVAGGTSCSDSDACNGTEVCDATGSCVLGPPPVVDDENPCTADACDPVLGVTHALVPAGTSCADANACNGNEYCDAAGQCVGTPLELDDGNPCTVDACDPVTGIVHSPAPVGTSCDNADLCDGAETCDGAGTCAPGVPPELDDQNACTLDSCDPILGVRHEALPLGTSCADGNLCNGSEICSGTGQCQGQPPPPVDDGNPCTLDACDPSVGVVHSLVAAGTACPDGNVCNGEEICSSDGVCQGGPAVDPDDANPCTADSCNPVTGVVNTPLSTGTTCSDGQFCNGAEACDGQGVCRRPPTFDVDDGNDCTTDLCDETLDRVVHAPVPVGSTCGGACGASGSCDASGVCDAQVPGDLDDGNPCTADTCTESGVAHVALPVGTSCSDDDICNGYEVCNGFGVCSAGVPLEVNDGDPCTLDVCDPVAGVSHVAAAVGASCSDGNSCNGAETCDASGSCVPGAPTATDDGNLCTRDVCDPASGAVSHPFLTGGASCADGNACNGLERCDGAGTCLAGTAPPVDDGNSCTVDSCDPGRGVEHVWDEVVCAGQQVAWQELVFSRPSPRDSAAMAYDAARHQLVVFGGENAGASLADTWTYDLTSQRWTRSDRGGPPALSAAGMVFDTARNKFVLFGGLSGAGASAQYSGSTWEYDPASALWERRSTVGPGPRAYPAFAYDESDQIALLFGGSGPEGDLSDTWVWDGASGSWSPVSGSGPPARASAALAFDSTRGRFVLFGGGTTNASGADQADTWEYDPTGAGWREIATTSAPPPRSGHAMAFDALQNRVVLHGGTNSEELNLSDTWRYDGSTGAWLPLPDTDQDLARTGHAMAFDTEQGALALFGGLEYSESGLFTPAHADLWFYDSEGWRIASNNLSGPAPVQNGVAYDFSRQRIVARSSSSTWEYDSAVQRWEIIDHMQGLSPDEDMSTGKLVAGANGLYAVSSSADALLGTSFQLRAWNGAHWSEVCDANAIGENSSSVGHVYVPTLDRILIVGQSSGLQAQDFLVDPNDCSYTTLAGQTESGPLLVWDPNRQVAIKYGGLISTSYSVNVREYNPATSTWTSRGLAGPRATSSQASAAFDAPRQRMVLVIYDLGQTWEYDVVAQTWTDKGVPPPGNDYSSRGWLTFDETRGAVAHVDAMGRVSNWSGTQWLPETSFVAAPQARNGAAGGWNSEFGVGYLFGGVSGDGQRELLDDLWIWRDGWTLASWWSPNEPASIWQAADGAPSARTGHVLGTGYVPSSTTQAPFSLLYGGEGDGGLLADAWLLNDETLTWERDDTTTSRPPALTESAIALDPGRGYILFGGLGVSGPSNEMYGRTSTVWSRRTQTRPTARYSHAMVTDPDRKIILLFGGRSASGALGDTWEYNASVTLGSWRQLSPPSSPSARFGHKMVYDSARGRIVLTGGTSSLPERTYDDTWEWDPVAATWVLRSATQLQPRAGHWAIYDDSLDQTVVFGGLAYREEGRAALSYGDTIALLGADNADLSTALWDGASCSDDSMCASGHCTDGVCCNVACTEQCGACNAPGSVGVCTAVLGVPRGDRPACEAPPGTNDPDCGWACNGNITACGHAPSGRECGDRVCVTTNPPVLQADGVCDGQGACVLPETQNCGNYGCQSIGCTEAPCCVDYCRNTRNYCSRSYSCYLPNPDEEGTCVRPVINSLVASTANPVVGQQVTLTATGIPDTWEFEVMSETSWPNICPRINDSPGTASCVWVPTSATTYRVRAMAWLDEGESWWGSDAREYRELQITVGAAP